MLHKFFLWFVCFFGMLSIFGIYLGYLNLIYAQLSFLVIVFSAICSFLVVKRVKRVKIKYSREIALILLGLLALDVYVSLPYMIYPHSYVDFGLNVAQGRLITQMHGFSGIVHVYPNVYYGIFVIFNSIVLHAYTVSSVIAVVMQVMTVFGVFLVGKDVFDEKVGLIASFLYGFSLVNIMLLEQGYLTQNFATFFFVSSMYLVVVSSKNRSYALPLVLSLVGLMSYPHYFAIMFLAILVYFRRVLKYLMAAILVGSLELFGLLLHFVTHEATLFQCFVMDGGILVPNLFVLCIFVFAAFGYLRVIPLRRAVSLLAFANTIASVIFIFVLLFLVNYFIFSISTVSERNLLQLYTPIKMLYLFFVPVSLLAAFQLKGFAKRRWSFVVVFFVLYFSFFAGYLLILPEKNNLPPEVYSVSEFLVDLNRDHVLGFDECMLQDSWVQPSIYDTLYGRPDNYTVFSVAESGFLLQSQLVERIDVDHSRGGDGTRVSFARADVDYFVTTCNFLDKDLYYSRGNLRIYKVS